MKANELRIGNWVRFDNCVPAQMTLADFSDWYNDHNSHEFGDYIHPIPITEEWLLKFGFRYQDRDVNIKELQRFYISPYFGEHREYWIELNLPRFPYDHSFTWLHWDIGGGKRFIHLPNGDNVLHVHQIQNLYFALTGEEL